MANSQSAVLIADGNKTIKGSDKADKIDKIEISNSGNVVNAYAGNDTATLKKMGDGNQVSMGSGNDTLKATYASLGNKNAFAMDDGNDTVDFTAVTDFGTGNSVDGGAGADTLKLSSNASKNLSVTKNQDGGYAFSFGNGQSINVSNMEYIDFGNGAIKMQDVEAKYGQSQNEVINVGTGDQVNADKSNLTFNVDADGARIDYQDGNTIKISSSTNNLFLKGSNGALNLQLSGNQSDFSFTNKTDKDGNAYIEMTDNRKGYTTKIVGADEQRSSVEFADGTKISLTDALKATEAANATPAGQGQIITVDTNGGTHNSKELRSKYEAESLNFDVSGYKNTIETEAGDTVSITDEQYDGNLISTNGKTSINLKGKMGNFDFKLDGDNLAMINRSNGATTWIKSTADIGSDSTVTFEDNSSFVVADMKAKLMGG